MDNAQRLSWWFTWETFKLAMTKLINLKLQIHKHQLNYFTLVYSNLIHCRDGWESKAETGQLVFKHFSASK